MEPLKTLQLIAEVYKHFCLLTFNVIVPYFYLTTTIVLSIMCFHSVIWRNEKLKNKAN